MEALNKMELRGCYPDFKNMSQCQAWKASCNIGRRAKRLFNTNYKALCQDVGISPWRFRNRIEKETWAYINDNRTLFKLDNIDSDADFVREFCKVCG